MKYACIEIMQGSEEFQCTIVKYKEFPETSPNNCSHTPPFIAFLNILNFLFQKGKFSLWAASGNRQGGACYHEGKAPSELIVVYETKF